MNRLQRAFLNLHREPMQDREVTWLSRHRPSVAFLLCICSGPWVLQRRMQVQAKVLAAIGCSDLCELRITAKLFPLAWQRQLLRSTKMLMRRTFLGRSFDEVFAKSKKVRMADVETLRAIASNGKIPKVLWMFVRDYWKQPCMPVDRHVRRWCEAHRLPTTSEELVTLFNKTAPEFQHRAPLQAWARVIFAEKSTNPTFTAQ